MPGVGSGWRVPGMMAGLVRLELDGAIARVTLARGESGNAISLPFARELRGAAETCASDTSVRVVLLRAEGSAFCVGGDIAEFEKAGDHRPELVAQITTEFHAAEALFIRMRAPLVVAVQGPAAGAGLSLAAMGDIVMAARSAYFTAAYTAIGLSADGGSTYILPRIIGLRRTQELLLTNRRLSAEEALEWGLVTSIHEPGELPAQAEALAQRLAAGPTAAYGAVKRLLAQTFATDFESQVDLEGREIARLSGGPDAAEGIAAFRAKRSPDFLGRPHRDADD